MRHLRRRASAYVDGLRMAAEKLSPPHEIEVGAVPEKDLRYWRAKEAIRQAELRLGAQASARQALETRATALLGWIVAVSALAGSALGASGLDRNKLLPLAGVLVPLFAAAVVSVGVIWPTTWSSPGHSPKTIMRASHQSELEQLESIAEGYEDGINENWRNLKAAGRRMRVAFTIAAATPLIGLGLLLISAWAS